jgi:hypothetical protein
VVDHGAQADAEVEGGGDQQGEERFDRVHAAVGLRVLVDLVEEGGGREPLDARREPLEESLRVVLLFW